MSASAPHGAFLLSCSRALGLLSAPTLVALFLLPVGLCDEIAFVDVTSGDGMNIRSLDTTIKPLSGMQNLFSGDPMAAHDWANPQAILATLDAHVAGFQERGSAAASRLEKLRNELAPLYEVMPKNEHGRLDNGTARYALHRHFAKTLGWSVKGLEPAGASWIRSMTVTPDVKQVTKYIAPAFLMDVALSKTGDGKGMDLHWLTLVAATIRHMAHGEIMEYLYSVVRALEHPVSGKWRAEQVDEIVCAFLLVYTFGTDLQASRRGDLLKERSYLENHHQGWNELRAYAASLLSVMRPTPDDFHSTLRFVEDFAGKYGAWQDRDCKLAAKELAAMPGQTRGRVPFTNVKPLKQPGRRALFSEDEDEMEKLGALERGPDGTSSLVIPNYVLSLGMCLTTAGVHTVCCRNPCDELLERAEAAAGASEAKPDTIIAALGAGAGNAEELSALAASGGRGVVPLHGRGFAEWMHRAYPLECPVPNERNHTSPRTPAEWMTDPGGEVSDTQELIDEVAAVLARYTTLGSVDGEAPEDEASGPEADAGEMVHTTMASMKSAAASGRRSPVLGAVQIISMVALALAAGRSMLIPAVARMRAREKADGKAAPGRCVSAWTTHPDDCLL